MTESSTRRVPVISVVHLKKTFGKKQAAANVLNDVSFDIFAGEYVIIFGPSGCGKSTLLHSIAGLEPIDDGDVKIRGKSLKGLNESELAYHRHTRIGLVFQSFNVLKSLTVLQNVVLPQMFVGAARRVRERRAHELLGIFGLNELASRVPTELSGGQQQRVAIARALINNPWILLFDEPTGNLDSVAAGEVMNLINGLNRRSRRTVLMVTHNPEHLKYADRVIYLRDGRIEREAHHLHHAAAGTMSELTKLDRLREASRDSS